MSDGMDPKFKARVFEMVKAVRTAAEEHTEGWPVNVYYEGTSILELKFKVVPLELPTTPAGRELIRRVGNIETGEYTFYMTRPFS